MRGRFLRWLPAATLACLLAPPVLAAEPGDARSWLARIEAAAYRANYQGTLVIPGAEPIRNVRRRVESAELQNQELATNIQAIAANLSVTTSNLNRSGLWGILWSHKPPTPPATDSATRKK